MTEKLRATIAALVLLLILAPRAACADCKLLQLAEFHADISNGVPMLSGAINGQPIKILIDSGSEASMVMRNSAERLGLSETRQIGRMYGLGGDTEVTATLIKQLKVDSFVVANLSLRVAGDSSKYPWDLILGDDFLAKTDVEFDLADGFIRLFKPEGCEPAQLVYWGKPYSQATLLPWAQDQPSISTEVKLNGHTVMARLDTGASESTVDSATAESLGVSRDTPGANDAGAIHGLGPAPDDSWVANFESFALGDETISHPRLHVTRMLSRFKASETGSLIERRFADAPAFLVGADFLRAHRVFVANQEHLMVFSYSGGPVFLSAGDLAMLEYDRAISLNPDDADNYIKRGAARRRQKRWDLALQDFDEAVRLAPGNAEVFFGRGLTYDMKGDLDAAVRDYDESIRLKPDAFPAYIDRGVVHDERGELALAIADFDRAIRLKPDSAAALIHRGVVHRENGDLDLALRDENQALRLTPDDGYALTSRAEVYAARGEIDLALKDFDDAIRIHPTDADNYISRGAVHTDRREIAEAVRDFDQALHLRADDASALNGRCWARAVGNVALDAALADCNASLALAPHVAESLDSRAFVYFRLGQFNKAVVDENAALEIKPKLAGSLYIRGLSRRRLNDAGGDADLAAARLIDAKVADTYARLGVSP